MVRFTSSVSRLSLCWLSIAGLIIFLVADSLGSPHVSAAADKKREGAELFATRGCTHCHGDNGQGTDDGPALLQLRKHLKPAQIRQQIVHGGKQMPAFGDTLTEIQVSSLVAFLRAKTWVSAPQPPSATPATPAATKVPDPGKP